RFGVDHAAVAEAQRALAQCLTTRADYREAERLLVASARTLSRDRYRRREAARTMRAMAALYRAWGRPDKAREAERLAAG
ncbi:MAG TPA: hypothetical protein VJ803_06100, partial [Gemmatimonadaceae bacterium]|nr:hypothetical protein [Gemmatimonadaceae bacterium]